MEQLLKPKVTQEVSEPVKEQESFEVEKKIVEVKRAKKKTDKKFKELVKQLQRTMEQLEKPSKFNLSVEISDEEVKVALFEIRSLVKLSASFQSDLVNVEQCERAVERLNYCESLLNEWIKQQQTKIEKLKAEMEIYRAKYTEIARDEKRFNEEVLYVKPKLFNKKARQRKIQVAQKEFAERRKILDLKYNALHQQQSEIQDQLKRAKLDLLIRKVNETKGVIAYSLPYLALKQAKKQQDQLQESMSAPDMQKEYVKFVIEKELQRVNENTDLTVEQKADITSFLNDLKDELIEISFNKENLYYIWANFVSSMVFYKKKNADDEKFREFIESSELLDCNIIGLEVSEPFIKTAKFFNEYDLAEKINKILSTSDKKFASSSDLYEYFGKHSHFNSEVDQRIPDIISYLQRKQYLLDFCPTDNWGLDIDFLISKGLYDEQTVIKAEDETIVEKMAKISSGFNDGSINPNIKNFKDLLAFNNPQVIPALMKLWWEKKGMDGLKQDILSCVLQIVEKNEPELVEHYITELPENLQQFIRNFLNKDSNINSYFDINIVHFDGYSAKVQQAQSPRERTVENIKNTLTVEKLDFFNDLEKYIPILIGKGWNRKDIKKLYVGDYKMDLLDLYIRLADDVGLNKAEFLQSKIYLWQYVVRDFFIRNDEPEKLDEFFEKLGINLSKSKMQIYSEFIPSMYLRSTGARTFVDEWLLKEYADEQADLIKLFLDRDIDLNDEERSKVQKIYKDQNNNIKDNQQLFECCIYLKENPVLLKKLLELYRGPKDASCLMDIVKLYNMSESQFMNISVLDLAKGVQNKEDISLSDIRQMFIDEYLSVLKTDQQIVIRFIVKADRQIWKIVFGEEFMNNFLNSLPKATQEKRNAFTHNEFDRTSEFFDYIYSSEATKNRYGFDAETDKTLRLDFDDLSLIQKYIEEFGLAKTYKVFEYYRTLLLVEKGEMELPEKLKELGLLSLDHLKEAMNKIKTLIYGHQEMMELPEFSDFEIEMLGLLTGKSTHSFHGSHYDISEMINQWRNQVAEGEISPKPEEYNSTTILTTSAKLELENPELVRDDYELLSAEILLALETKDDFSVQVEVVKSAFQTKIQELQKLPQNKHIKVQLEKYQEYLQQLTQIKTLDELTILILDCDKKFFEKNDLFAVLRLIVFKKVMQINFSPEQIQHLVGSLEGEMDAKKLININEIIKTFVKEHVLNIQNKNKEKYWSDEAWEKIVQAKENGKQLDLSKLFKTKSKNIEKAVETIKLIYDPAMADFDVEAIPDRGFIGEMSGYLANVCYTAEYPLLQHYPNVVPYKFVRQSPDGDYPEFFGSVLVFELKDNDDNDVMLIRGFDIPKDSEIDLGDFFERFVNHLEKIAKQKGIKKIIMPGLDGAITNYSMTQSYLRKYRTEKRKISLKDDFAFNGYNITENCYVVRDLSRLKFIADDSEK